MMNKILLVIGLLFGLGCSSNKSGAKSGGSNTSANGFIEGVVNDVQRGKDGYTARIISANDKTYFVTISHSNLIDPAQYRSAKTGDTLSVKGDTFSMNNENHITVRELK